MEAEASEHNPPDGSAPVMDESWWQAVLAGADRVGANDHDSPTESSSSGSWGSAEDWMWARELFDADDTIDLPVIGYNRGGLLVEAKSLRGFIPVSHIVDLEEVDDEDDRCRIMEDMVGGQLCVKVIEYDPERGRLVLSQRAAMAGPGKRLELLDNLESGQCVCGEVTNITPFGVFVDLGGVEGLVHVSELSWGRVRHPEDVVCCGDELDVKVLSVDRDQARVALSVKELLPDPWQAVEERFEVGEIIEGEVTNVVKFGAFVGIEEGLEGLIHVSELGEEPYLQPSDVLVEGDQVRVRVIHIDAKSRRLGLSLRGVDQPERESNASDEPQAHERLSRF